jgi:exosortase/archaeosortase
MFWRETAITITLIAILIVLMVTGIESEVEDKPEVLGGIELAAPGPKRLFADEQIVSLNEALDLVEILFVAILFGVVHIFGPRFRTFMQAAGKTAILGSLGGGIAVAYIFLQLLPELEAAEGRLLGDSIHLIVLVGFVVFWGLEVKLQAG